MDDDVTVSKRPGAPLTRQRSAWRVVDEPTDAVALVRAAGGAGVEVWRRDVHDGRLTAIRSLDYPGYGRHLSISHAPARAGRAARYPTWDVIAHARYELLPVDRDFVMHLPPPVEFVAVHDTTFHLHESEGMVDECLTCFCP